MTNLPFINNRLEPHFMGQGSKRLYTRFCAVYNFIQNVVDVLSKCIGVKQTKFGISNFFSLGKEKLLSYKHTQNISHHIKKHHRKYLFGGAFSFLLVKIFITLLTTYGSSIYAQTSQDFSGTPQYFSAIGNGIVESAYEQCDDGNIDSGDGCSDQGQIETGYTCEGSPSLCVQTTSIVTGLFDTLLENTDYQPEISIDSGEVLSGQLPGDQLLSGQLSDQQLIEKFYGPQSTYTNQWNQKLCNLADMQVEHVTPGINTLPRYPLANTMYVLSGSDYINDYMINIQSGCTAIIAEGIPGHMYTTKTRGASIKISSGSNAIIDNLVLHGNTDGLGNTHSGNNYGIFVASPSNTLSHIQVKDVMSFAVYMEDFATTTNAIQKIHENIVASPNETINIPVILPTQESTGLWSSTLSGYGYVWNRGFWGGILPLDLRNTSQLFVPINFSSFDQRITISFLSGTRFSTQEGLNYNGIVLGPKSIALSEVQSQFSGEQVLDAFKVVGNQGNILLQNTSGATQATLVTLKLSTPSSFSSASIFYSTGGDNRQLLNNTQIINSNGDEYIVFETTTLGYFAVVAYAGDITGLPGSTTTGSVTTGVVATGILLQTGNQLLTGETVQTGSQVQTGTKINKKLSKQERKQREKDRLTARGFKESKEGKMVGKHSINLDSLSGEINIPVIMQSTGNINTLPIEVELPEGTLVTTQSGSEFTGVIDMPQITDETQIDISNQDVVSSMKVGSDSQSLFFQDLSGNAAYATIRIPTPQLHIGDTTVINYSTDGITWTGMTDVVITGIDGKAFAIFQTNHFTMFAVGIITWDNTDFLDDSFRDSNPTTGQIIKALYGSGLTDKTVYNSHWNTNCQPTSVVYVQPYAVSGLNSMPIPVANTVYVLNSGSYIFSAARTLGGNCIAIVGKGDVKLYSNINLTSLFTNTTRSYIIFDNLKFDGYANGTGGVHATKNTNGLRLASPTDSTYNNIQTQQHSSYGISITTTPIRTLLNAIISHSNASYGLYQSAGTYININASSFFNNAVGGIYYVGNSGALNNLQIYNNAGPGLTFRNGNANILTNSQIYNNNTYGISITRQTSAASNMILKDVDIFNNGSNGRYTTRSTNNKFYNSIKSYGNVTNTLPAGTVTGTAGAFSGATAGVFTTVGTTGCNSITNPLNSVEQYYFTGSCVIRSNRTTYSGWINFMSFSTGTKLQAIPYIYTGAVPGYKNNLFMDSGYHIGEGFWDIRNYVLSHGYKEGTGALYTVSSDTLVGSGYLNFQKTNGKTYKPVVLQSTGIVRAEALLPKYAFIRSGSYPASNTLFYSYNSVLNLLNLSTGSAVGLSGVKGVISFNHSGLYLTNFSGNYLTASISIPLIGLNTGDSSVVTIYKSSNLTNRTSIGTSNITTIGSDKYSTFTSTGLSYFAAQVGIWDNIAPVLTGYTSSGLTILSGTTTYYKGALNIRANVSDTGSSLLSGTTCMYNTGGNRLTATYSGNITSGYCEVTGLNYQSDFSIIFSIADNAGNIGYSTTGVYIYDVIAPIGGAFVINNDDVGTTLTGVTFNITCPTDAGIGGVEVAYGTGASPTNRTACTSSKNLTLAAGDGIKTGYVTFRDALANTTVDITDTILLDQTSPTVSTGYISVGTTGYNSPNYYYKGTIDVRAAVNDAGGSLLDEATCEYNVGGGRYPATYNAGYCEAISIAPAATVNIQFRVQDNFNNIGTGNIGTYIYDATVPAGGTFKINNDATGTNQTGVTLHITCPTDGGIGGVEVAYGSGTTPTNRTGCTATKPWTVTATEGTKTVYMKFRDAFQNTTTNVTDTIIYDITAPTTPQLLSPTSGQAFNTGTVNLLRSGSTDVGAGMSGYIRQVSTGSNFANILNSGSLLTTGKTLTGLSDATYYRRIYAYDVVGNTGTWTGRSFIVHTIVPTVGTAEIYSGTTGNNGATLYYKGGISIRSIASDVLGINTCEYTTGSSRVSANRDGSTYCYKTGLNYTSDVTINFRVRNVADTLTTGTSKTYIYDTTAPTGLAFKINNDAIGTNQTGTTLNITCPTDAGVGGIQIAYGNSPSPTNRTTCSATTSWNITTGDGTKTVYMRTRDALTNTTSDIIDTIIYDTTLPSTPALVSPYNGLIQNTGYIGLRRGTSTDTGMGISGYIYQLSTDNFSSVYLSGTTANTGININGLPENTYQWRIYAVDAIGNTSLLGSTWTFTIDFVLPTASIYYSTTGLTNQNVIATLTGRNKPLTGINATGHTFTGNGTFLFTFSDLAGNTGEVLATVNNIDKTKPTASIYYSITGSTTFPVNALLTGYSENLTGINTTGYTFTGNGIFLFTFSDLAGNTGSTLASVDRIYIPSITGIDLLPSLSPSYFGNYDFVSTISGSVNSASVDFKGINADGGNCTHYYASGSCMETGFNYPLFYSGGQTREVTGVWPDQIYPQISFAPANISWNNTPEDKVLTTNNYSILHMQNQFSMTGNTSFWVELNAYRKSTGSVNLGVYLVEKGHDVNYFTNDWTSKTGVEMIGIISRDTPFHHQHTDNATHYLIALSTNNNGTIGNKNLNISGDFWIVLYPNTTDTTKGWDFRYQPSSLCENISGWYQGNKGAGWTTSYQSGCPDTHIHIAKRGTGTDGLQALVTARYNSGVATVTGSKNFYFGDLSNMTPNATEFITPFPITYTGDVHISWNPALDPNNDILTYNLYLLSTTGTTLQTLITGTSSTSYNLLHNTLPDGEYGLKIQVCDSGGLCADSYLDDNFLLDTTHPTATVRYSTTGWTNQNVTVILTGYSEALTGISATGYTFTGNGTYTFTFSDLVGNTGSTTATVTWIDKEPPQVSTGYIAVGLTGSNNGNLYFKGTIEARANVSDNFGLDTGSCQSSSGAGWMPAFYSGTSTGGYCYQNGTPIGDINLRFKINGALGNISIGATGTYLYDATAPIGGSFSINSGAIYTTTTGVTLNIVCPTDGGIGGIQVAYGTGTAPTNWTGCVATKSFTLNTVYGTKTVYTRFRDAFDNQTTDTIDTILLDIDKPLIYFTGSSLDYLQNDVTYIDTFTADLGMVESGAGLKSLLIYWDQWFPAYDASTLLMMNMNNISSLGESEGNIKDISLYGNHGSGYNVSFVTTGDRGGGYEFTQNNSYIKINGTTGLDIATVHTISSYVYPYINTGLHVVVGGSQNTYALGFDENNLYYKSASGSIVSVAYQLPLNTRTYLNVVRSGNLVSFYVDKVQVGTTQTLNTNTSLLVHYLGNGGTGLDTTAFVGIIDEPRIFNRAMTSGEIAERHNVNLQKISPTEWKFSAFKENLIQGYNHTYYGYVTDNAGNTGSTQVRTIRYVGESIPPSVPEIIKPLDGSLFATATVDFEWTQSVDTGAGMQGYEREIASDSAFVDIVYSGFVLDPDTGTTVTGLIDGVYYRHVRSQDLQDNDSLFAQEQLFVVDTHGPILSTGYISSGLNILNQGNMYYKGVVDVRSDLIYDLVGVDKNSCQYSTGGNWIAANYSGTITSGYCEVTGLNYQSDFTIRFRIQDIAGTLGMSTTGIFLYDSTPPEGGAFTINNNATGTNSTGVTLNIMCPTDGGAGYVHIANGPNEDPDVRVPCISTLPYTLSTGDGVKTVYVRFKDALSNITLNYTDSIIYDTTGPLAPTLQLPTNNYVQNTGTANLRWNTGFDSGVGVSGYMREVSTDNFTSVYLSGTTANTGINISGLPQNTYQWRVHAMDALGNMGSWSTTYNFIVDFTVPILSTGYVSSGATGFNTPNYYFKGIVNIRSNVSDTIGLSGATCEYTTGTSRASAVYSGAGGYCEKTGLNYTTTLNLRFRIQDTAGNTGTSATGTYIYDGTAPTGLAFKINNDASGTNLTGVTLNITCPTDAGVSGIEIAYGNATNPTNRTGCATTKPRTLTAGDATKTVYMRARDALATITTNVTDTIIYDTTAPTIPSLQLPINNYVQNTGTVQLRWSTGSDAGVGMSGYIWQVSTDSFSTIYLSGTTVNTGTNISSLPANTYQRRVASIDKLNKTGSRSSSYNFIVDFTAPALNTGYISSGLTGSDGINLYYKGSVDIRSIVSDVIGLSGATCEYTTGTSRASAVYSGAGGYCEVTGLNYTTTLNLRFRILDTAGNTGISATGTYIYDGIAPTGLAFTINNDAEETNLTGVTLDITCPTDAGISGIEIAYGNSSSPTNWTGCSTTKSWIITSGDAIKTVYMRTRDVFDNISSDITDQILYDTLPPSAPELLSPISGSMYNTGRIVFLWSGAIDPDEPLGIVGDYMREISQSSDFSTIYFSGEALTTGVTLHGLEEGTYYRRVHGIDDIGNMGIRSDGSSFVVDFVAPTLSTGYISSGLNDLNAGNIYYKGIINIRSNVSDINGLSGATCMYTTGTSRASAMYSGNGGYCEATGLNYQSDFTITFRILDTAGNTGTSVSQSFLYDSTPPEGGAFTINNNDIITNQSGVTLNIMCPTDAGVGYVHIADGPNEDPDVWVPCVSSLPYILSTGDGVKTVYVRFRDALNNITTNISDSIVLDTTGPLPPPLISPANGSYKNQITFPFVRGISVDTGAGVDIYVREVSTDNFNSIAYSGETIDTGMSIYGLSPTMYYQYRVYAIDSLGNIGPYSNAYSFGVDRTPPLVTTGSIESGLVVKNGSNRYYKGTIDLYSFVSDDFAGINGTSCTYTTGGNIWATGIYHISEGICNVTGLNFTSNINVRFKVSDLASNTTTSKTGTYFYDEMAPTGLSFTIDNNATGTNITGVILNIICPTDAGVGGVEIAYGNSPNPTNRTGCSATKSWVITTGDGVKTVYMATRDVFANTSSDVTDTIIYDTTGPLPPILLLPTNNRIYTGTTGQLVWSAAIDQGVGINSYMREVSQSSDFSTIYLSGTSVTTGVTLTGFDGQRTYYRRVHAMDSLGYMGSWSSTSIFSVCTRNNDVLVNSAFRDASPSDVCVVNAFYGNTNGGIDQTAYTSLRSGNSCVASGISVMHLVGPTDKIPLNFAANTLYKMENTDFITTGTITMNNCTVLVDASDKIIYSDRYLSNGLISISGVNNTILYGITLDGINNGIGGTHTANTNGISYTNATNTIIYTTQSYNATNGISINNSNYIGIGNSQFLNNTADGIFITNNSKNILLNNLQLFNNTSNGLSVTGSSYLTINNSQFYKNGTNGITVANSPYIILNNSQSYNNAQNGLRFFNNSLTTDNNKLNNIYLYNNGYTGLVVTNSTGNKYYSILSIFSNLSGNTLPGGLSTGNISEISGLSRNTGNYINTGVVSFSAITNPVNASGQYLQSRNIASITGMIGTSAWTPIYPFAFSYGGSGVLKQIQVVRYIGTGLTAYGVAGSNRNTNYFIGSKVNFITGSIDAPVSSTSRTVTTVFTSAIDTNYTVFGDIQTSINGTVSANIGTSQDVLLSGGIGNKNIIIQYFTGTDISTHYVDTISFNADVTPPTIPVLSSPASGTNRSGTAILRWTKSTDVGLGVTGYQRQLSLSSGFTTIDYSGSVNTTGVTISSINDGIYYRRVNAYDANFNYSSRSTGNWIVGMDTTPPDVGDPVGYSGNYFYNVNDGNYYYKGTISLRSSLYDSIAGLKASTCKISLNGAAYSATSVTQDTSYCYRNNYAPAADFDAQFAVQDNLLWTGESSVNTFVYDNVGPVATILLPTGGMIGQNTLVDLTCNDGIGVGCFDTGHYYQILNTTGACPSTGYIQYSGTEFLLTGTTNQTTTKKICAYSKDILGTTGITSSGVYIIDATPPTGFFKINSGATSTNSGIVTLVNTGTIGATLMRFSNGSGIRENRTGFSNYFSWNLDPLDGVKVISGQFDDGYGNIFDTSATITLDTTPPVVSTGYIASGITGVNGSTLYYKGIITLRADVSDGAGIGLSGNTCQYTTGGIWTTATYSGAGGYCEVTGINYQTGFSVVFRVQDGLGNQGIGATGTYVYDITSPSSGSFIINTGILYTTTTGINLHITCPIDTGVAGVQIAYGNSSSPTNWTSCVSTIPYTLLTGDGSKTVYVAFRDGLGNTTSDMTKTITLDSILPTIVFTGTTPASGATLNSNNFITQEEIYDVNGLENFDYIYDGNTRNVYDSGLVLMYNFNKVVSLGESGTYVRDFSPYSKNGVVSGGATWIVSGAWDGAYTFDGIDDYISIGNGSGITLGTIHTINLWVNPSTNNGTLLGSTTGVGVSLSGSKIIYSLAANNSVIFNTTLPLSTWTFVSIVRNGINVSLYKNGVIFSTMSLSSSTGLYLSYVGKENNGGSNEKNFSGSLDEIFIYNRSTQSINQPQMLRSNFAAIGTGRWLYTSNYSCVATSRTYNYTGIVSDFASNQSQIIRATTVAVPSTQLQVTASSLDMGIVQGSSAGQTVTGSFTGYFKVNDRVGTSGWYTTITLPTNLVGKNRGFTIPGSNMFIKASGINTLSGQSTESIYVAGNFSDYVSPSLATTYIKRDASNIPYMCPGGVYGNNPLVRLDIPPAQAIDTYSGTIIYDIIY